MSYMDTAEDELDYGEEELGEQDIRTTSFQPGGAIPAIMDDEMVQDDEYEDLYDDVNIGYFEAPGQLSMQRNPDDGDGFDGDYGEEESYYGSGTRISGGGHGDEQHSEQRVTGFEQSGEAKMEEAMIPAFSRKEEKARALPLPQSDTELKDDIGKQQMVSLRSAGDLGAKSMEGMPSDFEEPNKEVSITVVPSTTNRPHEDTGLGHGQAGQQLGWTMDKGTAPAQAKGQADYLSNVSEQGTLEFHTIRYDSPKDRGDTGLVPASGESLVTTVLTEIGAGYDDVGPAGRAPSGVSHKMVGSGNVRGRGGAAGMLQEGGKGTAPTLARSSQVGTQRASNVGNDHPGKHGQTHLGEGGGATMLFVGELHWWTTDAELEAALSEFGRVKNLKFSEERASGKSRGYCEVEFYDHAAAVACKEKMNGRKFNDRPCVVAFANSRTFQHMGNAQVSKAQAQLQAHQPQTQFRRGVNDAGGPRGGYSYQGGDNSRNYGRIGTGGRASHGQGMGAKGGHSVPGRSTRGNMGGKGMNSGAGSGVGISGAPYGQGLPGSMGGHPSGIVIPQGIVGQGYDPGYVPAMARGAAGYGGYVMQGPPFQGMVTPFPNMGPGGLPGVAPHVNPAFFGRSATANGMGMMSGSGRDGGHHTGMWGDASMGGWNGEERERRAREASYGEDAGGSDYGYGGEMGHDKSRTNGTRDKERVSDGDLAERRRRDDRDGDWERERHRERDGYREQRERERDRDRDDDWDRDRSVRTRSKARTLEEEEDEEEQWPRSREEEYGKRRRLAAER